MSLTTWKEKLSSQMNPEYAEDVDFFETQINLRQQGKIEDKVFAEIRLRRGCYGQRYDNGKRHDGLKSQTLDFGTGKKTKGPDTLWDAPGMLRIKLPFGGITPEQMEVFADVAEEYSDEISHITTRQDIQLHFVHLEDMPNLMRRLAAVDITTKEACGNSVRNITACPLAGVCRDESFDVSSYADATFHFLWGHPDVQDFGRKFKISFSGCKDHPCGLSNFHDLGFIAKSWDENGEKKQGFEVYVGGGLGTIPYQAKLLDGMLPIEELLPISQSIARVYARLGEKKNRNKARIKFLVAKLGIEEFGRLVLEERKKIKEDPRWLDFVKKAQEQEYNEEGKVQASDFDPSTQSDEFQYWYKSNVYQQSQKGYSVVTINLNLGDITSHQMRLLADITRKYTRGTARTTVEQNFVIRWVSNQDLPAIYEDLKQAELNIPDAGTIVDIVSCPGTDTCKLGMAASRGLADELRVQLAARSASMDEAIKKMRIKVSGCFNSCSQHHVADIGFWGNGRNVNGFKVPHFQVVVGGTMKNNGETYGLAIGAVPSKRVPEVVDTLTTNYLNNKEKGEDFRDFAERIGRKELKNMITPFMGLPEYESNKFMYSDWADPREFTLGDIGIGECAGEVVSLLEFDLAAAEADVFEAQIKIEEGDAKAANQLAYHAMLQSAKGLIKEQFLDISDDPDEIYQEFKTRFYDTKIFFDKYAGGKFAKYFFERHEDKSPQFDEEATKQLIGEAQLFIEAVYSCDTKIQEMQNQPA